MTISRPKPATSDQSPWDVPKLRQCLRCKATFSSKWSGERICARCKGSTAWRSGAPHRSFPSSNRR